MNKGHQMLQITTHWSFVWKTKTLLDRTLNLMIAKWAELSSKTVDFGQKPVFADSGFQPKTAVFRENHSFCRFWAELRSKTGFQPKTGVFAVFEFKTTTLLISFQSRERKQGGNIIFSLKKPQNLWIQV